MKRRAFGVALTAVLVALPLALAPANGEVPPQEITWLAGGDSFSSGHGTPGEQGTCRQNSAAWPQVAREQADVPLAQGGYRFAACSGNVMSDLSGQANGRRYDLVTFSFGGNDIDFAGVVSNCVLGGLVDTVNPWLRPISGCEPDANVRRTISARIGGGYRDFLRRAARDVVNTGGNVVVVGYPAILEDPNRWVGVAQSIDLCNGIRRDDAAHIRGWAGMLNSEIGKAVDDVNRDKPNQVSFRFVNIQDGAGADRNSSDLYEPAGSSVRHNLCASEPWLNGLTAGPINKKGFHPTLDGHSHTGRLVAGVIQGLDWSRLGRSSEPTPTPTPTAAPRATVTDPKPTARNLQVSVPGPGAAGVSFDVGWQSGRDPVTCHFFIDGVEAFSAQCGTRSSKQFSGLAPGRHAFYATVSDRFGIFSDPTATVERTIPGQPAPTSPLATAAPSTSVPATQPPVQPRPTARDLVVVIYGGGHVGVAFEVGWQAGRDPVTCHFFRDGVEVFTAQCGTHSSKQFYNVPVGNHSFYATVTDRFGVASEPTAIITKYVT